MPRWGRTAAAVLAALVLCLSAAAACASMHEEIGHPALEMEARVGYDGMITYGKAIPLRVRVVNHGEDFEGALAVNAYVNKKEYDRFEIPVTLPQGSEREYLLAPTAYARQLVFTAEITRDGETLCAVNAEADRAANPGAMLVGVLSTRPQNLSNLNIDRENDVLNRYEQWQTVPLTPETFPEEETLLDAFGMLVTDDIDPETLSERQLELLDRWLRKGHILLCGGGAAGARSVAFFSGYTGLRVTGFSASDSVTGGLERSIGRTDSGRGLAVSLAEMEGAAPLAADAEGRGLVWRTEAGPGRIYTMAFEAGDAQLNAEQLMHWYWQQVLVTWDQGAYNGSLYSGGRETSAGVSYGTGIMPIAARSRILPGLLIAAGVPVLGSLCWLVLKKADRRQWMWAALPLLAAAATAGLVLLSGASQTNRPMAVITENIVQGSAGTLRSYVGITAAAPDYGRHTYATDGEKLLVNSYDYVDYEEDEDSKNSEPTILRTCYRGGSANEVSAVSVTPWESVSMSCEAKTALYGAVDGTVWMEEDGLHGEITNGTDCRLADGLLITSYGFASLPPLAPGEKADVFLEHRKAANPADPSFQDGGLYLNTILSMYSAVYQALGGDGDPYAEEDEKSLRSNMINNAAEQIRQEKAGRNYSVVGETAQFLFTARPEGLPVPRLSVDGKPVEQAASMSLLTAQVKYLEVGRSGLVFRPAGTDVPVRVETDGNNRPAGEYRNPGAGTSYHSLVEQPTFRFDLESLRSVRLDKLQITMEEYYTRQSWAYALNARTGEWDEVPINEPIANPEDYLDAEGKLYLQFRSDTQDQYVDIPTPGLLIEGKLSDGRQ